MIEIKEVCKQDYKKAQKFAIQGMHLDWYMDSKVILDLYAKYFWYMELNRATKVYGAYADDIFVGVLLAEIKNEPKRYYSVSKAIYVKIFDWLQHLVAGKGVEEYDEANKDMYKSFCQKNKPDGEIIFLAADPDCKIKGVGTALLSAFEKDESGKLIYLYTDNACTYQFYEHRGFERSEERQVVLDLDKRQVPLLWSSIFVTLMANKIGGLQFGIYRNCQISSRVFHTAVAALPLTKANRSDFE